MFEPFHSRLVEDFAQFPEFPYRRPDEADDDLAAFCQRVFLGRIRHPWIDRQINCLRPELRVVKEVRVNFMLKWLTVRFPAVRPVLIIRHPCAVVSSRMEVGWTADTDLQAFLSQDRLVEDFLAQKMDVIRAAQSEEEKHALVWCISYAVPLQHFGIGAAPAVFYEDLVLHPETALGRAFMLAGMTCPDSVQEFAERPSLTARPHSAVVTGADRLSQWKSKLSTSAIESILSIVDAFDLDDIYGDSVTPLESASRHLAPIARVPTQ